MRYILISTLIVLLCGCGREEFGIEVKEGEPAHLTLSINTIDAPVISTKGMTTPQERSISNLYILVFDSSDVLVHTHLFTTIPATISMDTYSGANMKIYAVANYDGMEEALGHVSTVTELNEVVKSVGDIDAVNPGHLTLVGNITKTILANNSNTASIDLYYLAAKISVKVVDATLNQDVTFFGWEAYNLPVKGYLIQNASDAVNPSSAADFFNITGDNHWEKEEVLDNKHTLTQTFYMLENRRGVKSSVPYSATAYKDKTANAVDYPHSTYFKISMNCYNRNDGNTYVVNTLVYLGADNYKDYNILRSKHYTYTITISGVNSITVDVESDSNSSASSLPISINTSSSMTMDAHPDMRVLMLNADSDSVKNVSIEILGKSSWLKLSPLNLLMHQVSQLAPANLYQQSAPGEGYFVRPRYIPHKSFREANPGLSWSEWPSISDPLYDDDKLDYSDATYRMCFELDNLPFNAAGDQDVQICLYSEDYPFTDGTSTRSATLRISYDDMNDNGIRKYFDYPIVQKQPMNVGLIVDTYALPASGTFSESNTTYKRAVIEQIEESALILFPENLLNQQTTVMQWGYYGSLLYSYLNNTQPFDSHRNGYYLTANAVYNNVTKADDGSSVTWNTNVNNYRPKYGSRRQNSSDAQLTEPAYTSNNSGAPYYLPIVSSNSQDNVFYNPIFNTSAARYCHEKNRDLNGDGVISPAETQWYLPSQHELYQVWISLEAIRYSTTEFGVGYYWSSSENDANSVFQIGFQTGFTGASPRKKNFYIDGNNDAVRCIRKESVSPSEKYILNDRIIDSSNLPADAKTNISKGSATGMQGNDGISTNSATVYYKFQVAKSNALPNTTYDGSAATMTWKVAVGYSNRTSSNAFTSYSGNYSADSKISLAAGTLTNVDPSNTLMNGAPVNSFSYGCAGYYEKADESDKGEWRLPNKRELFLIWIYRSQLESFTGFDSLAGMYWSASERDKSKAHIVNMSNGLGENPDKSKSYRVRCIREI